MKMSVFTTPIWETSDVGDKNASQLFNTGVPKISKKIKTKNWKQKAKNNKRLNNTSKVSISNSNNHKTPDNLKNGVQKRFFDKTVKKKEHISRKINGVANKNNKHNINGDKVLNKNKFQPISKSEEKVVKKIEKRKLKQSKQRNKIENSEAIFGAHKHQNNPLSKKNLSNKDKNGIMTKAESRKQKLMNLLNTTHDIKNKRSEKLSLRERMIEKLKASRFRYINEQIYNSGSKEIQQYFEKDPDAFQAYHEGYRQQVSKWPLNPVDVIIKSIRKMSKDHIIADLGCGDAKLAKSVPQKVHSFDLVAANDIVIACDMSQIPLENESVDVVVFCLSLMGNNIKEYLFEANRILKNGGILKIAEVESRFDSLDNFLEGVKRFGFVNARKDLSHDLFYFLDFKKTSHCKSLHKLPTIGLHPCLYKKR